MPLDDQGHFGVGRRCRRARPAKSCSTLRCALWIAESTWVTIAPAPTWSFSGAALLEPWRRRARGEFPLQPRVLPGETPSERCLWDALDALGAGWRREFSTGKYRLDFYLPSHRLAVGVDGGSHFGPVRAAADASRDAWHLDRGIRTLRVSDREVMADVAGVVELIRGALTVRLPELPAPADERLSPSGEEWVEPRPVEVEQLSGANARVDSEIEAYAAVACVTVLPVLQSRRWGRLFGR